MRVNFNLDDKVHKRLKIKTLQKGYKNISQLLRLWIEKFLKGDEK